ncbi:MAG: ABC transporter ATP-binding protein [bacterium]|nr:ABC transporter ATP-binding protein [bacterium]
MFSVVSYVLVYINPLMIRYLIDEVIAKKDLGMLGKFIILVVGLNVALIAFRFMSQRLNIKIGLTVTNDKRKQLYKKVLRLNYKEISGTDAGDLLYRINQDAHSIMAIISRIAYSILNSVLSVVIMLGFIFYLNVKIGIFIACMIPFYVWISFHYNREIGLKTQKLLKQWSKITEFLRETLSALLPIKKISCEEVVDGQHVVLCNELTETSRDLRNTGVNASSFSSVFSFLGNVFALGVGGVLVIRGNFTMGSFVAIFSYVNQFFAPLQSLVESIVELSENVASCVRVKEIMEKEEEDYSKEGCQIRGESIELRGVDFSYGKHRVLEGANLALGKGKINVIAGKSGAGKSTVFNMVLRFLEAGRGSVYVDGKKIGEYNPKSIRQQIGVVEQEPFLFNNTIRFNISLGKNYKEEEIENVCRKVNLWGTIEKKEKKLEYVVGAGGDFLSVGEKQRLAIARALVRGAKVLLLDEPTSNLDEESRKILYKTLTELKEELLVVLITHNFNELAEGDVNFYTLEEGRINIKN